MSVGGRGVRWRGCGSAWPRARAWRAFLQRVGLALQLDHHWRVHADLQRARPEHACALELSDVRRGDPLLLWNGGAVQPVARDVSALDDFPVPSCIVPALPTLAFTLLAHIILRLLKGWKAPSEHKWVG